MVSRPLSVVSCARALAVALLCAVAASAQTFRGHLLGTVTDPQGATVKARNVGIGNPFLGGGGPRNIRFAARLVF